MTDPALLTAIAELLGAIAWPLVFIVLSLTQRRQISALLANLESLTLPGGIEAKLRKSLDKETSAILRSDPEAPQRPTEDQLEAAQRIQRLASAVDLSAIRHQVTNLAAEYERLRATMPAGHQRTRRMEIVATKMRTLGLAAVPLLPELTASDSPGERLAAIAVLQVSPSQQYTTWLADRLSAEKPFLGYHAAVALTAAARVLDEKHSTVLQDAINSAKKSSERLVGTDRWRELENAENALREAR